MDAVNCVSLFEFVRMCSIQFCLILSHGPGRQLESNELSDG